MPDFTELKQRQRARCASGEYDRIAHGIREYVITLATRA
jgi:hypothetical protein